MDGLGLLEAFLDGGLALVRRERVLRRERPVPLSAGRASDISPQFEY